MKGLRPTDGLFIFRNTRTLQNSQQATIEDRPKVAPLPIPRSGTTRPLGTSTLTGKVNIGRK